MFVDTQILSNTIKHGKVSNYGKVLVTEQGLIVFDTQTFPIWRGLKTIQKDKRMMKTMVFAMASGSFKILSVHSVIKKKNMRK